MRHGTSDSLASDGRLPLPQFVQLVRLRLRARVPARTDPAPSAAASHSRGSTDCNDRLPLASPLAQARRVLARLDGRDGLRDVRRRDSSLKTVVCRLRSRQTIAVGRSSSA
jgi:hypothetical protein